MKAHWVSYVLGFLCGPAGVTLSTLPVSQEPLSISLMRVNSSAKITCSTSLPGPMGLSLNQAFPNETQIVYVNIENGLVNKETYATAFKDRVAVAQQIGEGHSVTFQLSLLGLGDTNLYHCDWNFFNVPMEKLLSPGTIVIIREKDPKEQCRDNMFDYILLALSVTALFVVAILCIGALIVKCKRIKRRFSPAGAAPPRPNRPQHGCPHHQVQNLPYLITSLNTDFRGIL